MTTLTRVASVALLTSSLAGPVYASNVSSPTGSQASQNTTSVAGQNAPASSIPHTENAATSTQSAPPAVDKNAHTGNTPTAAQTASPQKNAPASTQSAPPTVDKNSHTGSTPTAAQTATPQQNTPASTQSAPPTVDKNSHTGSTPTAAQTATPQQNAPASTQSAPPTVDKNSHTGSTPTAAQTAAPQPNAPASTQSAPPAVDKNAPTKGSSPSEESAQGSHTAAAAAASNQNTTTPQAAPVIDAQSFTDERIPTNDEKSWVGIGVRDGHTAASLNHIFEQTVSNPHHKDTDNPEFFNNIHSIVDALNDHKFTLGDLSTLIAEHHHQEEEGKAEELGPDLTNIIIDSAAKIHHGASAQETVGEITAQQHAIDEAEKKEQND